MNKAHSQRKYRLAALYVNVDFWHPEENTLANAIAFTTFSTHPGEFSYRPPRLRKVKYPEDVGIMYWDEACDQWYLKKQMSLCGITAAEILKQPSKHPFL